MRVSFQALQRPGVRLAALLCAAVLALAPAVAEAKAGSGASMGSRGARTYSASPSEAAPMQRSMTAPSAPSPSLNQSRPSAPIGAPAAAAPGFAQRNPFMTGLMGGFIGAGIGSMLFGGGGGMFSGGHGSAGFLGLLLQLAVIGGLVWLVVSLFRRRGTAAAEQDSGVAYASVGPRPQPVSPTAYQAMAGSPGGGVRNPEEVPISDADFTQFSQLLTGIQAAWSRSDLAALRGMVTPEMLSYFAEQLAENSSRGVENRVENVSLVKGDLNESWDEGHAQYCTVTMRWRASDYMLRAGTNQVVEGSPSETLETAESWTFLRARGGKWLLSAIQQVH